jgi:short-subunit dehydrogenase
LSATASATVLITGASSGIGAAFGRALAAQGHDLVLVARRQELLKGLADELQQEFQVNAQVYPADLSDPADVERVAKKIGEIGDLEVLINNAGFGVPGKFVDVPPERNAAMIQVHVLATVRLCRAALPGMIARRRGSIINVSSIAAFMGSVRNATYSATKAYLNVFSEALQDELKGSGVRVQALCPGLTHTEFHDHPGYGDYKTGIPEFLWMKAEDVVAESLAALERGRVICIPGFKNRLIVAAIRNRPCAFVVKALAARFNRF